MSDDPDVPEVGNIVPRCSVAVAIPDKFDHYCLDPSHPRGKDKAVVFASALGYRQGDGGALRAAILAGLQTSPIVEVDGDRRPGIWECTVDIDVEGPKGERGTVRTIWEVTSPPHPARLLTLYVKKSGRRTEDVRRQQGTSG